MAEGYTLIRSDRKSVSIQVTKTLDIVVRAPLKMARRDIDRVVENHAAWIAAHREMQRKRARENPEPTREEEAGLRERAKAVLPGRVSHFAARMGLAPTAVRVTGAKTRFGSCSGQNSLNFSLHLMRYPPEAVDYVVVHELAHIAHKNHGRAFYALVEQILPDWRARRALLKR